MAKKRGSNVIVNCDICGKPFTKAGLIGHLRFIHGKDYKAPLFDIEKPMPVKEAMQKARLYNAIPPIQNLYNQLQGIISDHPGITHEKEIELFKPLLEDYCRDNNITIDELFTQLDAEKKRRAQMDRILKNIVPLFAVKRGVCDICGDSAYLNGCGEYHHDHECDNTHEVVMGKANLSESEKSESPVKKIYLAQHGITVTLRDQKGEKGQ